MTKPFDFSEKPYLLFNGDCLEVMKTFESESFDMVLTSPPYDSLRNYEGYSFDFETIAQELFRVTKQGGVVVWVVGDATVNGSETGTSFRQALYFKEIGFNLHDTMIYWKNSFAFPEQNRYASNFEYMFVLSKGSPKTTNIFRVPTNQANRVKNKNSNYRNTNGTTTPMKYEIGKDSRNKENIWIYECGFSKSSLDDYAFQHPAIFPEQLAADHILSWTNEGDVVCDCFLGSGNSGKMAIIHKRKFVGIEVSEKYLEIAKVRIGRANLEPTNIPTRTDNLRELPLFEAVE